MDDPDDTSGWALSPEGEQLAAEYGEIIRAACGIDELVRGIKAKFREKEWLVVDQDGELEIWSFEQAQTVTALDKEVVARSRGMQGNLLEPDDAICEWLALKLVAARDGQDDELTPEGRAMRKWLEALPISRSVKDGTCLDEFLSGDTDEHASTWRKNT